jgi:hypothetical protein
MSIFRQRYLMDWTFPKNSEACLSRVRGKNDGLLLFLLAQ